MTFNKNNSYSILIGVGRREVDNEAMTISATDSIYMHNALLEFDLFEKENIFKLTDSEASKSKILDALRILESRTAESPADFVLLYFSGHGSKRGDVYHLICRDTNSDLATAIDGHTFVQSLNNIRCNKMVVFLDCCHAEGIGNPDPIPIPFDETAYLKTPNRVILTACARSQVSYLSRPISLFTYALIEALGGKFLASSDEKVVTVFNLAMDVRERVVALSKQVLNPGSMQQPQLNVLQNSATNNFEIAMYPLGGQQKVRLLSDTRLQSYDRKDIDHNVPSERDEKEREKFAWIFIQNIAHSGATFNQKIILEKGNVFITNANEAKFVSSWKFNQVLIKQLIKAIKQIDNTKENSYPDVENLDRDNRELADQIILKSYDGILGFYIRTLFSIGDLPLDQYKMNQYSMYSLITAKRTLQMLTFSLISKLWAVKKKKEILLTNDQEKALGQFFKASKERDIRAELDLLKILRDIFSKEKLDLPIPEIDSIDLTQYGGNWSEIASQVDAQQCTLDTCVESEKMLSYLLEKTIFLTKYKLVSIKETAYEELPHDPPNYLHSYEVIELDKKGAHIIGRSGSAVWTDAILLYKTEFHDGINLYPFIIDFNALTFETEAKLYYYNLYNAVHNTLSYKWVEDGKDEKKITLEQRRSEYTDSLRNDEVKRIKLNRVLQKFREAQSIILG